MTAPEHTLKPTITTRTTINGGAGRGSCADCGGYLKIEVGPQYAGWTIDATQLCSCQPWDLRSDYERGRDDERDDVILFLEAKSHAALVESIYREEHRP